MEYIKHTLERVTTFKLTVEPLFHFLNEVARVHPSQEEFLEGFTARWNELLHSSISGIILCYVEGCWLPTACEKRDIANQSSWSIFARKYVGTFQGSAVGSQECSRFQPINFEDLIQLSFWSELYGIYGFTVVTFIFEKCLILLPLKECFYNCIGHSSSLLLKRINRCSQPSAYKSRPQKSSSDSQFQEDFSLTGRSTFINPFEIRVEPTSVEGSGEPQVHALSRKLRKRKRFISQSQDMVCPKKRGRFSKPCIADELPIVKANIVASNNATSSSEFQSETKSSKLRWVTPTPEIIRKLRTDREQLLLKRSQGSGNADPRSVHVIPASGSTATSVNVHRPTFVSIMNDKYFKGKLDLISKEIHVICPTTFSSRTNPKLAGLRLPKKIMDLQDKIEIIVHRISESAARKYNLRIKPRKRYRKSMKIESKSPDANINNELTSDKCSPPDACIYAWEPFNPVHTLRTDGILFKKSYNCTWPPGSHMSEACSMSRELKDGVSLLLSYLLKYSVNHSKDVAINPTTPALLLAEAEANSAFLHLQNILCKIVIFHRRVKNTSKLVRNCVEFWEAKQYRIGVQQESIRLERKKQKELEKALRNSAIPIVDLTENTPTSNSTEFSASSCATSTKGNSQTSTKVEKRHVLDVSGATLNDSKVSNISGGVNAQKNIAFKRLKETIRPSIILSTISHILHLNGAIELFGSNSNRKAFFKYLKKSIFMAGVKSGLQLGGLMANIKPNACIWLNGVQDCTLKMHLMAKVVSWLFVEFVLNILKISFYATDSSTTRMQVVFYLRDTWRSVGDRVKLRYEKLGKLTPVDNCGQSQSQPPESCGSMRLIPKKNNQARPILSLKETVKSKVDVLQCKLLLNYLTSKIAPHGINDGSIIRDAWKKFMKDWSVEGCPKLYFIRVDIRDAFPSVALPKLKQILLEESEEKLVVKQIQLIGCGKIRVKQSLGAQESSHGQAWHSSVFNRPSLIRDTCKDSNYDACAILSKILEILESDVIRIGKRSFKFSNGLPQGWALSQSLCNIYYGHMDRTHFSEFLNKETEFFIRTVDDYFYVSPNPHRIALFFKKMRRGMSDYCCSINSEKSLSNIYVSSDRIVDNHEWVPFFGWRFCLTSGHVARDFSSYANQDISSTLTFNMSRSLTPENFIFNRMGNITPLRLKHILLDPAINCRERILKSLFEVALMQAFRFYALCRIVYPNLNAVCESHRADSLLQAIVRCAAKLERYIRRSKIHLYSSSSKPLYNNTKKLPCCGTRQNEPRNCEIELGADSLMNSVKMPLKDSEVFFIVYHAFCIKLRKHNSIFKTHVIPGLLNKRNAEMKRLGKSHCDYLLHTVGEVMPGHFKRIKI